MIITDSISMQHENCILCVWIDVTFPRFVAKFTTINETVYFGR